MSNYSRLHQNNAFSYVANAIQPSPFEYYEDFEVESVPVNSETPNSINPVSNTGVKYPEFDRDASRDGKNGSFPLYHAGVDWVTFSGVTSEALEFLEVLWCDLVAVELDGGYLPKKAKWLQYQGQSIGSLFFGTSVDGCVLRASARIAGDVVDAVRARGGCESIRCTRLDLQATVIYPPELVNPPYPAPSLFREIADTSYAASITTAKRRGRPWFTDLRDTFGRGDTCYIGDRASESFLRSYDKHYEARNNPEVGQYPLGAVRFESEQKGTQAVKQFQELMRKDGTLLPGYIAGYVAGAFSARGVVVPIDATVPPLIKTAPHATDVEKTKEWYQTAVAPSVARMLSAGVERDELLKLFGLAKG